MELKEFSPVNDNCDKCNEHVPPVNNAVILDFAVTGNPMLLFSYSRHLLPVVVDGQEVCAGSPSRAQYLPNQPRDTRGYRYNPDDEALIREGYARMLAEFGQSNVVSESQK